MISKEDFQAGDEQVQQIVEASAVVLYEKATQLTGDLCAAYYEQVREPVAKITRNVSFVPMVSEGAGGALDSAAGTLTYVEVLTEEHGYTAEALAKGKEKLEEARLTDLWKEAVKRYAACCGYPAHKVAVLVHVSEAGPSCGYVLKKDYPDLFR